MHIGLLKEAGQILSVDVVVSPGHTRGFELAGTDPVAHGNSCDLANPGHIRTGKISALAHHLESNNQESLPPGINY